MPVEMSTVDLGSVDTEPAESGVAPQEGEPLYDWAADEELCPTATAYEPEDPALPEPTRESGAELFVAYAEGPNEKRRERLRQLESYYDSLKASGVMSCYSSSELPWYNAWRRYQYSSFVSFRDKMNRDYSIVQAFHDNDAQKLANLWPIWGARDNSDRPLFKYVETSIGYGFLNCNEWAVAFALAATLHGLEASFCQAALREGEAQSRHAFALVRIPWQPDWVYLADPYYLIERTDFGALKLISIAAGGQITRWDKKDAEKAPIPNLKIGWCSNWLTGNGVMLNAKPW